jgi:hypothetical protein
LKEYENKNQIMEMRWYMFDKVLKEEVLNEHKIKLEGVSQSQSFQYAKSLNLLD